MTSVRTIAVTNELTKLLTHMTYNSQDLPDNVNGSLDNNFLIGQIFCTFLFELYLQPDKHYLRAKKSAQIF